MIELVDAERAVYLQQRGWAWKFKRKGLGVITPTIKVSRTRSDLIEGLSASSITHD